MARAQPTGFLLAQTTTYVGLQLFMFVAPWWALEFTESPLASIGIFLAITLANTLPGPLVGHLVDKSDPLRLLQTARIFTVLLLAIIALISFVKLESIGLVCLLVGLVGFTEFLYSTAFFSAVPRFIDRQGLLGLNSRLETINAVAGILAPIMAGHLLVLGNFFTVAFGAVAALLALGLLGFRGASAGKIGGEEGKSPDTESLSKTSFVQSLRLSVRQTLADKKLLYLIANLHWPTRRWPPLALWCWPQCMILAWGPARPVGPPRPLRGVCWLQRCCWPGFLRQDISIRWGYRCWCWASER